MTSKKRSTIGVTTRDTPQERLKYLHDTARLSWREIANLDAYRGIPAGTLCRIAKGWEPAKKYRARLGMAPTVEVIVIGGELPPGVQIVPSFSVCKCGNQFFTTSGRKNCYICRAWRGKR